MIEVPLKLVELEIPNALTAVAKIIVVASVRKNVAIASLILLSSC